MPRLQFCDGVASPSYSSERSPDASNVVSRSKVGAHHRSHERDCDGCLRHRPRHTECAVQYAVPDDTQTHSGQERVDGDDSSRPDAQHARH